MSTLQSRGQKFPDEIIEDILVRLPVKSLLRFKCVSKSWCSLFTEPGFTRANLNKRRHGYGKPLIIQCGLLFPHIVENIDFLKREDHEIQQKSLDCPSVQFEGKCFMITCCCDGILLMTDLCHVITLMALWNPRINKYKILPVPEPAVTGKLKENISFGYDSNVHDYKVVRILSEYLFSPAPKLKVVQVLNVKSNMWRTVNEDLPYTLGIPLKPYTSDILLKPVSIDGGLYWIARKTTVGPPWISTVLRFDLAEENFREVPMPQNITVDVHFQRYYLGLSGGSICLGAVREICMDLWVMKEETHWDKLLSIPTTVFTKPLCFIKDGALLMICEVQFIIYDPEQNNCSELELEYCCSYVQDNECLHGNEYECSDIFDVFVCSDSLISPSGGD